MNLLEYAWTRRIAKDVAVAGTVKKFVDGYVTEALYHVQRARTAGQLSDNCLLGMLSDCLAFIKGHLHRLDQPHEPLVEMDGLVCGRLFWRSRHGLSEGFGCPAGPWPWPEYGTRLEAAARALGPFTLRFSEDGR